MMMQSLFDILINFGGIGLLAGYLLYQNNEQRKLLMDMQARLFQKFEEFAQVQALTEEKKEEKFERREDALREKYDKVIEKLDGERKLLIEGMAKNLESNAVRVEHMTEAVKSLSIQLQDMTNKIITLQEKFTQLEIKVNTMERLQK